MVFSSIPFLFFFLPIVLIIYFSVPAKLKNTVLLISSLIFYGWGEPKFLIIMLLTIAQGYAFGILIEKKKGRPAKSGLAASVFISLSVLLYCKYANFFIENFANATSLSIPLLKVTLPIGISFYTFQIISYVADVYRGIVPAQRNFINLAAYISMFPQLIAGPIVRYSDIAVQLESRKHSIEKCSDGIRRFVIGLGKKVLIANVLGELCAAFSNSADKTLLFYWMYAIANALHIYFDFSGYSDMAIGLGKILGFDFSENFNYPFISRSMTEFWRRWHISLGSWFRDYVYIPLGGNRVSKFRHLLNILVVWLLTGFWHGADWNFIFWGLYFAVVLIVEKLWLGNLLDKSKILGRIYVLLNIAISFVIFDSASIGEAGKTIKALFGFGGVQITSPESIYYLKSYAIIFVVAIIGSTPLLATALKKAQSSSAFSKVLNIAEPVFLIMILCAATAYIVDGSFNPFLYFRF